MGLQARLALLVLLSTIPSPFFHDRKKASCERTTPQKHALRPTCTYFSPSTRSRSLSAESWQGALFLIISLFALFHWFTNDALHCLRGARVQWRCLFFLCLRASIWGVWRGL